MAVNTETTRNRARLRNEAILFAGMLGAGILLLPLLVYAVGQAVFGAYAGDGYGDFFGALAARLRNIEPVAWFLVLSPYLALQSLRLAANLWRATETETQAK